MLSTVCIGVCMCEDVCALHAHLQILRRCLVHSHSLHILPSINRQVKEQERADKNSMKECSVKAETLRVTIIVFVFCQIFAFSLALFICHLCKLVRHIT